MSFIAPKDPQGYSQVEFVAYTNPSQKEGLNGEVVTGGVETFVRYIHQIKIDNIQEGGRTGDSKFGLVVVHFDPHSIGLKESIRGNTTLEDPVYPILKEAYENGQPVDVAIEFSRRAKTSNDKEPIHWYTPIQALRGSKAPGEKGTMEAGKNNTKSAIAMVNGTPSNEIVSNPEFWHELEGNRKGFFTPEGYKRVFNPEDWAEYSYITPDADAAPKAAPQATSIDLDALADKLADKLGSEDGRYYKKPSPKEIGESAPYATHTRHGLPSLGHYTVQRERFTFAWAYEHLKKATGGTKIPLDVAWELTRQVFHIADGVQVAAYGNRYLADRHVSSHTEASRWVEWVIDNEYPYPTSEDADKGEWSAQVGKLATQNLIEAARMFAETFNKNKRAEAPSTPTQPSTAAQGSPAQQSQGGQAPAKEDKVAVLNRALTYINSVKDNTQALRGAYTQAQKRGLLNAPVAEVDGQLVFDPKSGEKLGEAIKRWGTAPAKQAQPLLSSTPKAEEAEQAEQVAEETPAQPEAEPVTSDEEFLSAFTGGKALIDWAGELSKVDTPAKASELWSKAQGSFKETITLDGEEMTLEEAFNRVSAWFVEAQELAEKYLAAPSEEKKVAAAEAIKDFAHNQMFVSDGVSDEQRPLIDLLKVEQ